MIGLLRRFGRKSHVNICPPDNHPKTSPVEVASEDFTPADVPLPPDHNPEFHESVSQATEIQLRVHLLRARRLNDGDDVLTRRPRPVQEEQ